MPIPSLLLLPVLLVPAPQGEAVRAVPPKSTITVDAKLHESKLVVVKFAENAGVRLERGTLVAPEALDLTPARRALGVRPIRPFFAGLEKQLAELRRDVPNAPDLGQYFLVTTTGLDDSRRLIRALDDVASVELAYPKELPSTPPGDIPPPTPNFTSQQAWQQAAPTGFDAAALRQLTGAWGAGHSVLDIEWGWWFDHEDIKGLRPGSLKGPPLSRTSFNNHGTAVWGEIAADPDQYGVSGMTPDVSVLNVTDYPASGYSVARAILTGLPFQGKGDVMLLEAQTGTPLGLGPTEYNQADFDAIVAATRKGILVVEAAGNGNVNLDDARLGRRFDLSFRDSGAIIVGASDGSSRNRAGFSTYGSRIDANGWGRNVVTTAYGNLFNPNNDHRQRYSRSFGGTSSASPMVTSTVVALLAGAKAQWSPARYDRMVDHKEIRRLLRTYGTAMNPGQNIALRPDLDKLLRGAGLMRGLKILDDPKVGGSYRVEIEADFAAGARDAFLLLAAPAAGNVGVSILSSPCDRLLVDLATFFPAVTGTFATGAKQAVRIVVPNDPALRMTRFYWQGLTFRGRDGRLCLTSGSMAYVLP